MSVPDSTYFGEKPGGGGISYLEVRHIHDEQQKLEILKLRIDTLLIKQVDALTVNDGKGNYQIWSPFPFVTIYLQDHNYHKGRS